MPLTALEAEAAYLADVDRGEVKRDDALRQLLDEYASASTSLRRIINVLGILDLDHQDESNALFELTNGRRAFNKHLRASRIQ
jgi:hypothetical protein